MGTISIARQALQVSQHLHTREQGLAGVLDMILPPPAEDVEADAARWQVPAPFATGSVWKVLAGLRGLSRARRLQLQPEIRKLSVHAFRDRRTMLGMPFCYLPLGWQGGELGLEASRHNRTGHERHEQQLGNVLVFKTINSSKAQQETNAPT